MFICLYQLYETDFVSAAICVKLFVPSRKGVHLSYLFHYSSPSFTYTTTTLQIYNANEKQHAWKVRYITILHTENSCQGNNSGSEVTKINASEKPCPLLLLPCPSVKYRHMSKSHFVISLLLHRLASNQYSRHPYPYPGDIFQQEK